jgi:HAD superfamily hydrolase (TIGR01509 family)
MNTIIFDMDGVLIESEPYHIQSEIVTFRQHGILLTEEVAAEYLGFKLDDYISALSIRFDKKLDHQKIKNELHRKIEDMYQHKVPLVPNVMDTLSTLSKTHRLALATSQEKHLAKMVLERLEVAHFFEAGAYREDVSHGKPDPEVFLTAARLLGATPDTCVVIEDAEAGFIAGKRAGMRVIARKAEHNKRQSFIGADAVIEDLGELPSVLQTLSATAQ